MWELEPQDYYDSLSCPLQRLQLRLTVNTGDITGGTRIRVGPPGATQVGLQFKDLERLQVELCLQTDACAYSRKSVHAAIGSTSRSVTQVQAGQSLFPFQVHARAK